jgi:hypothetical protein
MAWGVQRTRVMGSVLVTTAWPDLALLPQPVFHTAELALLAAARPTPERYQDVALVKRLFRGAWVVAAYGPRKRYVPRVRGFGKGRGFIPPQPIAEEDE